VKLYTDDLFYQDSETGLLMAISCHLSEEKREAELARRSERLVEALAVRVAKKIGRPRSTGDDWRLAVQVEDLERQGTGRRDAVGIVAEDLMRATGIATPKAARARVNKALKERRRNGP
jgi:hypothetical protein